MGAKKVVHSWHRILSVGQTARRKLRTRSTDSAGEKLHYYYHDLEVSVATRRLVTTYLVDDPTRTAMDGVLLGFPLMIPLPVVLVSRLVFYFDRLFVVVEKGNNNVLSDGLTSFVA